MTNAIDLLLKRRSVPSYFLTEPGPDPEALATLLAIGVRVPDHGKLAPWRFIVFQGNARLRAGDALAGIIKRRDPDVSVERLDEERLRLAHAPLVIAVVSRAAKHPKIPVWEQELSVGAAAMNLLNGAHALGFAAQWLSGWMMFDDEAGKVLGLQQGERFAGFIYIGTPEVEGPERRRVTAQEVTSYWGEEA